MPSWPSCLIGFGAIAHTILDRQPGALDTHATEYLHSLASPTLDTLMGGLTELGSTMVLTVFCLVAVSLLWRQHRAAAMYLVVALFGAVILDRVLKELFHRPRPHVPWATAPPEYSFPSGHTMDSLAFYLALAIVVALVRGGRDGVVAIVLAVGLVSLIGLSRIYLGYHFLTDVAGGLLAGATWLLVAAAIFGLVIWARMWRSRSSSRSTGEGS